MNLSVDPVRSMEDATLNFEQLQAVLTKPGSQLPFLQLLSNKQVAMAFGSTSVVFTASVTTPLVTVTHGLGRTPGAILVSCGSGSGVWLAATSPTTTTFQVGGSYSSAITSTVTVYWLAVG